MIVSELIDLIKTLQDQIHKISELDEKYFNTYIDPVWNAFNAVHNDYKSSFESYLGFISEDDFQVNRLIEMIRQDSIDSANLRSDLAVLSDQLYKQGQKRRIQPRMKVGTQLRFLHSIKGYFQFHGLTPESILGFPGGKIVFMADHAGLIKDFINKPDGDDEIEFRFGENPGFFVKESKSTPELENVARQATMSAIIISKGNDKENYRTAIYSVLNGLQSRYHKVAQEYYELRTYLLS